MTIRNIYELVNAVAPFDTQMEFDNSGLLVGDPNREVTGILFALDMTEAVIQEAADLGANLIITHHPLMFSAIRRVTAETFEGRLILHMIERGIGHIACHTNLDQAPGGINDALAECCALLDVRGEGLVRVGTLPEAMKAGDLKEYLAAALNTDVRLMGNPEIMVHHLGMCSGAGADYWEQTVALGAEAFLSGEIKHHLGLAMADAGIPCFECGHFATEQPGIFALADALQSALNQVQYNLDIFKSKAGAYSSVSGPGQAV